MRNLSLAILVLVTVIAGERSAIAGEVGGVNMMIVPPLSDRTVSVPFVQRTEGTFAATAVNGSVVTIGETVDLNRYSGSIFYLRVLSGTNEGRWATIVSNTANTFTVDDASALQGIINGDKFKVLRHHTVSSVFPDEHRGLSFIASVNAFNRSTEILVVPTTTADGTNKTASTAYFFFNNRWNRGNQNTNGDNDVILPQSYFIIRNRDVAKSLTFTSFGEVETSTQAIRLKLASVKNDQPLSTGLAMPVRLSQLDLGGFPAFKNSISSFNRGDELFVFPNDSTGFNKPASITYYYLNGAWRKSPGSSTLIFDSDILPPGATFIIRKASGTPGTFDTWTTPHPF